MNSILKIIFSALALFAFTANAGTTRHFDNICSMSASEVAENNQSSTIGLDPNKTKEKFELIINRVSSLYMDTIAQLGAELTIDKLWDSEEQNASANQYGFHWDMEFNGGFYRHKSMTDDSFALTVCHELGHHLGGAPFAPGRKMSIEGQADYWSSSVCIKKYFAEFPEKIEMTNSEAKEICLARYPTDNAEQNTCYRTSMASLAMSNTLAVMLKTEMPAISKKDDNALVITFLTHPQAQCRLDTLMAGNLCELEDTSINFQKKLLDDKLTTDMVCSTVRDGQSVKEDHRPLCWFNEYNAAFYSEYKNKMKSKSLTGLKTGTIAMGYFNNKPGDYVIKLVPNPASAYYIKITSAPYKTTLPAAGLTGQIVFEYKFMKAADKKKLKLDVVIEYNGKVILNGKNDVVIDTYTLSN